MADLQKAFQILTPSGDMKRTMVLLPVGLAIYLAQEKVILGESQQELINACVYHVRKHHDMREIVDEYLADQELAAKREK